jgi:hypothetical protein
MSFPDLKGFGVANLAYMRSYPTLASHKFMGVLPWEMALIV